MTTIYNNEQFGYDIFADNISIYADSELYYCDGADAESLEQELLLRCNEQIVLCSSIIYNHFGKIINIMTNERFNSNIFIMETF